MAGPERLQPESAGPHRYGDGLHPLEPESPGAGISGQPDRRRKHPLMVRALMTAHEVEFVGGPLDGARLTIEGLPWKLVIPNVSAHPVFVRPEESIEELTAEIRGVLNLSEVIYVRCSDDYHYRLGGMR